MKVGFMFRILEVQFKCFKIKKIIKKQSNQNFYLGYLKDSLNILKL